MDLWLIFGPFFIDFSFHFKVQKTSVSTSKNKKSKQQNTKRLTAKRGGGYAALLRVGSAAPGLVPAHGVQSPIP